MSAVNPDEISHLRVVDTNTGDSMLLADYLQPLNDTIDGLQRDIRGWTSRYADLRRNKVKKAKESPLWPKALELFKFWQQECNHKRSKFSPERFWLVEPFLEDEEHYGFEICQRAIAGAAYDPYITKRKNGTSKFHNDWELIFRNAGKVEDMANRAPRGWQPPLKEKTEVEEAEVEEQAEVQAAQHALQEPEEG